MSSPRICVAQIGAPHGVRGEMRLQSFTQDPVDFASYGTLQLDNPEKKLELQSARPQKEMFLVKFKGIDDRDAAALLTNQKLYVCRDQLPLLEEQDDDTFYHIDLIGLNIRYDGAIIGRVVAVPDFGAGDLLEMRIEGQPQTTYLPFLKVFVPMIDIAKGELTITPPENFFAPPDEEPYAGQ